MPLDPTKKTGLGSSAALIVSFVAATLTLVNDGVTVFKKSEDDGDGDGREVVIHRYAQVLNALVQEKVGSGFDIACSVYGSQVYRRFTNVEQLT